MRPARGRGEPRSRFTARAQPARTRRVTDTSIAVGWCPHAPEPLYCLSVEPCPSPGDCSPASSPSWCSRPCRRPSPDRPWLRPPGSPGATARTSAHIQRSTPRPRSGCPRGPRSPSRAPSPATTGRPIAAAGRTRVRPGSRSPRSAARASRSASACRTSTGPPGCTRQPHGIAVPEAVQPRAVGRLHPQGGRRQERRHGRHQRAPAGHRQQPQRLGDLLRRRRQVPRQRHHPHPRPWAPDARGQRRLDRPDRPVHDPDPPARGAATTSPSGT